MAGQARREIVVRTELERANGGATRVRLSVADSGPGFADKLLTRAFEPYVTTKARGTGLGLAVVKKIADEHHARVELRNLEAPPGGARVSLIFPAVTSAAPSGAA